MNKIPDFVNQVRDVEQQLMAEWQSVRECWHDGVADSFYEGVMEPCLRNLHRYITGEGFEGGGLEQLVKQMDSHLQDMALLLCV